MGFSSNFSNALSSLRLFLNVDAGFYEASMQNQYKFHSKANVNLNYKWFSLSANIQQDYFTVIDMVNATINGRDNFLSYYLMSAVHKSFLRDRLNSSLSFGINSNSTFGRSTMLSVNLSYQVNKRTKVFSGFNQTQYSNHAYEANDLSFGFRHQLAEQQLFGNLDKSDIKVFVYYDYGDEPAGQYLIFINHQLLNTNSSGVASYKNLPQKNHDIQVKHSGEWYAHPLSINLEEDTTIMIPLMKIGRVNGSLSFHSDRFSMITQSNLAAITITAISRDGQIFETKTDSNGSFIFFLPENSYTVKINKDELDSQLEINNNEQLVIVEKVKTQKLEFQLTSKQRIIETKKFDSR